MRTPGRPRVFDLDGAIGQAQAVFWRHGFDGTSLAMLAAEIGVHKPSLYAAFGDKRALYLAAYEAYQRDAGKLVAHALERPALRDALTAFFAADLDLFLAEAGRGCFMLATAVPLASGDEDLAVRVRAALDALHGALVGRVEQARREGDLCEVVEPSTAVDVLFSTHLALANRARSGVERARLEETVERVITLVCRG